MSRVLDGLAAGIIAAVRTARPFIARELKQDPDKAEVLLCIDAFLSAADAETSKPVLPDNG